MDDELKLEEYFKSKGFEIFVAEDFVDFKAQMQYFHETKTIVGVTGAALINSAFMQKSGKLIELQVPLTVGGIEMIHIDYHGLSFKMDHQYLTISSNRKADTVLEKIQNNKALESLICE
jgi:capsular polysaccharide biosynthesis protein